MLTQSFRCLIDILFIPWGWGCKYYKHRYDLYASLYQLEFFPYKLTASMGYVETQKWGTIYSHYAYATYYQYGLHFTFAKITELIWSCFSYFLLSEASHCFPLLYSWSWKFKWIIHSMPECPNRSYQKYDLRWNNWKWNNPGWCNCIHVDNHIGKGMLGQLEG